MKSPHPTGESQGQIDTMNQHGKPEDAQARGTLATIWLVVQYEINSGTHGAVAAFAKEENARACAGRMVGTPGKYYSLQSMELKDVE